MTITIKEARQKLGKSQVEVAQAAGMHQTAISALEKRKDLLVSTLAKYAAGLGAELVIAFVVNEEVIKLKLVDK